MLVKVSHIDMESGNPEFTHVANVNVDVDEVEQALEYAYRWTNNIDGSWSRKAEAFEIDGVWYENRDRNDDVEVVAELPVVNGRVYGLRSTSVNDRMEVNGKVYQVGICGFEEVR